MASTRPTGERKRQASRTLDTDFAVPVRVTLDGVCVPVVAATERSVSVPVVRCITPRQFGTNQPSYAALAGGGRSWTTGRQMAAQLTSPLVPRELPEPQIIDVNQTGCGIQFG